MSVPPETAGDTALPGDPQALRRAAAALGLAVTDSQVDAMRRYLGLLLRWNATYNLTAVREPRAMLTHHLADCLAAAAALARRADEPGVAGRGTRLLDAGSGGGLPGAVLALMRPGWDVTCVDAVGKKAAFVRQVAGVLGLPNLHGVHARLGAWKAEGAFDIVTARAFASLAELVRLTEPLLRAGGCWMAMKGAVPDDEIAALPALIEVFHVEPLAVPGLDAQRCLVWMRRRSDS